MERCELQKAINFVEEIWLPEFYNLSELSVYIIIIRGRRKEKEECRLPAVPFLVVNNFWRRQDEQKG